MTSSIKAYNAFKKVPGMSDTDAQEVASLFELIPKDIATKQDIAEVRTEIAEVKYSLTVRMGGMLTAAVAVLGILMKIL